MAPWHPQAKRVSHMDAGSFIKCPPKIVWHTTEGTSLPNYGGSAPHFTFNPKTGELWQHIPITRAARALRRPTNSDETNRANCIQVELIGYAAETHKWPDSWYRRIAELARWIEKNAGVPRKSTVTFKRGAARLTPGAWLEYSGHLGHCHVPYNDHWDPGDFKIEKVLGNPKVDKWRRLLKRDRRIANSRRKKGRKPWPKWLRLRAEKRKRLIERDG